MAIYISNGIIEDGAYVWNGNPMIVLSGGTAKGTIVTDYGSIIISEGGIANSTTVNCYGSMIVSNGGTATETTLKGGSMEVASGGMAYDIVVDAYYTNPTAIGQLYVNGTANQITICSNGNMIISSGGTANNTVVCQGGTLHVASDGTATEIMIYAGGQINGFELHDDTYYSAFSHNAINISRAYVAWDENTSVYGNGIVNDISVMGNLHVFSGGITSDTQVYTGGNLVISLGGIAHNTVVHNGTLNVFSGGIANKTTGNGNWEIFSGGTANIAYINSGGNLIVSNGGSANEAIVNSSGSLIVSDGGIANTAIVNSYGNLIVSSGGTASIAFNPWQGEIVSSAGATVTYLERDASVYWGNYSAGMIGKTNVAEKIIVSCNDSMFVYSGGTATETMFYAGGQINGFRLREDTYYSSIVDGALNVSDADVLTDAYIYSGGIADNTFVSYSGSLIVSSGGIVNNTTIDRDGQLHISSGGVANTAIVGGNLIISCGGIANSTTINRGQLHISSGGTATETAMNSDGFLYISQGGIASNTILSGGYAYGSFYRGSMFVCSGGIASNTLLEDTACMYVSCGGTATRATAVSAAKIFVSEGASIFDTELTNAGVLSAMGEAHRTTINSHGSMYIFDGGEASGTTVNAGGVLTVSSGGVAMDTIINSTGYIFLSGTATELTVCFGATLNGFRLKEDTYFSSIINGAVNISNAIVSETWANVTNGGTATNTSVASGSLFVWKGGITNNTILADSGSMYLEDGGIANDTTVNYYYAGMHISSGGTANRTNINGSMCIYDGGLANSTFINDGRVFVSEGGVANNTLLNGGYMNIFSGGMAKDTIINSGGLYVSKGGMAAETSVGIGGFLCVASGGTATITFNPWQGQVDSSAGATVTYLERDANVYWGNGTSGIIGKTDIAEKFIISSGVSMFVYSGGTANDTTVNVYGAMIVSSGGTATIAFNPWQGQVVSSAGAAVTYLERDANVYWGNYDSGMAGKADVVENTVISSGFNMLVYSGGSTNNITVQWGGVIVASSGGTVNNTTLYFGSMYVYGGGTASNTSVTHEGRANICSGGIADNTTVHGYLFINNDGVANSTTVSSGAEMDVFGVANDVIVTSGGQLNTRLGGSASGIVAANGALLGINVYRDTYMQGTSNGSAFEMKNAILSGYTGNGGYVEIGYGGSTTNTTLRDGSFYVESGGYAKDTTMNAGSMTIERGGTACNTTITSSARIQNSGGKLSGELNITGGAKVYVSNSGVVDFTVTGRSASDDYLINDLSRISGTPTFTITVTNTQAAGNYKLAQNAFSVSRFITIGNGSFDYGVLTCNGGSIKYGDNEYSLLLHEAGNLTLEVKRIGVAPDTEAPTITQIAANTTVPTNQNVTVSAVFADNVALASKQYRLGSGNWLDYTGAITVTANTTIYFKAVDTAGNEANAQYVMSNIDKVAPTITQVKAGTTAATNQDVTVTANFADNVALKSQQYKIGNGGWINYTGAVTMTANGTVYFKAVDTAGNEATAQYEVSNIDKVAPTITQVKGNTTAATNQNVTVTATFADNVALKLQQYKIDNGAWQNYTNGVIMGSNGTVYFKAVDNAGNEATAQYAVSNIDKTAPTITGIAASKTTATNQDVTVTVKFADNVALKSQQYKIGDGSWQNYTSGITMTANGTVYFKAVDTAGNEATGQYTVSNIDKIAPDAPVLSVTPLNRTNGTVTVTATFASDVVKKEYSLDGKNWQAYTKAVEVTANTTIHVRGYDEAGNASNAECKITNIVQLDAEGPGAVILTPKVSKYNVTVKWTKPATQDKAKITGYEVEYNGKISIVKGTSLSLKNVAVSTGNTVQVRAIDSLGRYGALSQVVSFDVADVTAPKLDKITAAINDYTGTITWSGTDNVGIVKYVVTCAGQSQTVTSGSFAKFENLAVGKYGATVQAYDAAGNASKVGKVSLMVKDSTPPKKVTGLAIPSADAKYSALLSWAPGVDNSGKVSGYEIKLDNGKILKSSKNSLKVSKLSVGTHTYQVRAIDKDKNIGLWSDVQTFIVKDMTAPAAVSAKAKVEENSLFLTWKTPKDNVGVAGYILKHGVNLEKTETLTASQLSFQIDGIAKGNYQYQIVAVDAAGNQSKVKSGKATIKTELPMTAMNLELPDTIPSLAFDAGVSSGNANSSLRYDDPLAFCSALQTENELRLAASDLFAFDNEKQPSPLLAVGF